MDIIWREATIQDLEIIRSALQLYDESFPYEVREPHEVFYQSLQYQKDCFPNSFRFLIGIYNNKLCSFATAHYFANVNFGFIVYIVTDPSVRNAGLGSITLQKIDEILTKDAKKAGYDSLDGIALETEKEEMVKSEKERIDCIKRNHFFEKNNYVQIDTINHVQPPLRSEDRAVPLNLFIRTYNNPLTNQLVKDIIGEIYKEKYQKVNNIPKDILEKCYKNIF
ncbi:GNAT family N-acetyltransferase [Jeotgalibacillus marinus]|uniref:GNAT family N-acetyltransferase n=1 Tax=Jeotgalibacillus marinus TaxID=86667 RepID=A0ABV3Q342_9BACL